MVVLGLATSHFRNLTWNEIEAGTSIQRPGSISQNVIAVFVGCRTMTSPAAPCSLLWSEKTNMWNTRQNYENLSPLGSPEIQTPKASISCTWKHWKHLSETLTWLHELHDLWRNSHQKYHFSFLWNMCVTEKMTGWGSNGLRFANPTASSSHLILAFMTVRCNKCDWTPS